MITGICAMCGDVADCNHNEVCDDCATSPEYAETYLSDDDSFDAEYDDDF